ncbi:hypothetical protein [Marinilactibacillus piezotolerans]|uniref:hypothetical protein n=1 Tax=Marinilactibacillus piezotolerans TaxID=258723 RepID=UPI0009AF4336|nr:hypothetical protein [Marinilactibacillus piezotolerans]
MKKMAYFEWLKIARDWKTRILAIGFLVFFGTFSLLYRQQEVTLPEIQLRGEYADAQQIFRLIPESHFDGELGEEVQRTLGRNATLIGLNQYILGQQEGNTVAGIEDVVSDYLSNGRELAENNLFLHETTEFESYELLKEVYLPTRAEVEKDLKFYSALEANGLDIEWNPLASSQILIQQVELVTGVILFIFIALLAGDAFTKDQVKNWSVSQGLPIPWKKQWRLRSFMFWGIIWTVTLIGLAISYVVSLLFETTGTLQYPIEIFIDGASEYIPSWQYMLLVIGSGMLLSLVILLLTTGLSWIIRNIYLTILIVIALYFAPAIWNSLPPLTAWQPSFYVNIQGILQGESAFQYGLDGLVFWKLPFILLGIWLLLEISFKQIFNLIPTQSLGLQRRKIK